MSPQLDIPLSLWHMASVMSDLQSPSKQHSLNTLWPGPSYTAWWHAAQPKLTKTTTIKWHTQKWEILPQDKLALDKKTWKKTQNLSLSLIQLWFTCNICSHDFPCMTVHNTTQDISDNLPSYPPEKNITAPVLSDEGQVYFDNVTVTVCLFVVHENTVTRKHCCEKNSDAFVNKNSNKN